MAGKLLKPQILSFVYLFIKHKIKKKPIKVTLFVVSAPSLVSLLMFSDTLPHPAAVRSVLTDRHLLQETLLHVCLLYYWTPSEPMLH